MSRSCSTCDLQTTCTELCAEVSQGLPSMRRGAMPGPVVPYDETKDIGVSPGLTTSQARRTLIRLVDAHPELGTSRQREAAIRRWGLDETWPEIAARLGISVRSARDRVRKLEIILRQNALTWRKAGV